MFQKAFRVKSNTQMKGSDKKKFKQELKKKFPNLTEDNLNDLLPTKDEVIVSKVYTHNGESILVYFHQKNPMFFELEKDKLIFPTVYTLWRYPDLLLSFPTWSNVLPKLLNGADLMLPGIIVNYDLGIKAYHNGKIQRGDPVMINLVSNKSAVAVGRAAHSSEDMYMAGRRGKGVNILHCYGDQLWFSGSRQTLPEGGPLEGMEFLNNTEDNEYESEEEIEEVEEGTQGSEKKERTEESHDDDVQDKMEKLEIETPNEETEEVDPRSPQEIMDQLLENAFLQSWKTSAKKAELPMLTSNLFRVHMVAQCPKGKALDVKKSSFKKLSKFLAKMQSEGLIEIKELQKGVESIVKVNLNHEKIETFRVVKVVKEEKDEPVEEVLPCDKPYEPPVITELFTVSAGVLSFFKLFRLKKGDGLTALEVRGKVKEYVQENNLQDKEDKAQVGMDPLLAGIVLTKGENHVVKMSFQDLTQRIMSKMSDGYKMSFSDHREIVQKGKLDPVELTTATRSGNKKVTLVHNLDLYEIDLVEFARRCQIGVAASTSVHEAINKRPGSHEVLIQGNQIKFISKLLLETYKLPRKYVKGIEEATSKKKSKK